MLGKADLCKNQTSCVTGTLFISLLQKRKENSCHTQKRVNQCSVTDTRRQMGPMYKRFQHIYTCTHRIMHRRHTICHICTTATQRQHDTEHSHTHTHTLHFHRGQKRKTAFLEGRNGPAAAWRAARAARTPEPVRSHSKSSLVSELRYDSQSTRFCVLLFFKKNAENIEFERLCPSPIWLILRLASRQILTGSNMRTFFRCCCFFLRLTWHSVTANNHAGAWTGAAVGCFEQDFETETQRDIAAKMLTGLVCHFKYHPGEVPPTRSSGFYVVPGAV